MGGWWEVSTDVRRTWGGIGWKADSAGGGWGQGSVIGVRTHFTDVEAEVL